jgi:hypothetical protein
MATFRQATIAGQQMENPVFTGPSGTVLITAEITHRAGPDILDATPLIGAEIYTRNPPRTRAAKLDHRLVRDLHGHFRSRNFPKYLHRGCQILNIYGLPFCGLLDTLIS